MVCVGIGGSGGLSGEVVSSLILYVTALSVEVEAMLKLPTESLTLSPARETFTVSPSLIPVTTIINSRGLTFVISIVPVVVPFNVNSQGEIVFLSISFENLATNSALLTLVGSAWVVACSTVTVGRTVSTVMASGKVKMIVLPMSSVAVTSTS